MTWFDRIKSFFKSEPDKLFYEGQEITPIDAGGWYNTKSEPAIGPKFGDIVKVIRYSHYNYSVGAWFIRITGYVDCFNETYFAPVLTDDQLEEALNEIDELIIKQHE